MIRIYLVRHGIAVDHADKADLPDDSRPLTEKGRRRFRRLARTFARLGEPIDRIFTSPLPRAVQTAEILASALRQGDVGILESLRPSAPPEALLQEVAKKAKGAQSVALVGHNPQMTLLVELLGDVPRGATIDFKKGSIVRIDVSELTAPKETEAVFWLKPKSRVLAKGLPLAKPHEPRMPAKPHELRAAAKPADARPAAKKAPEK
ncbi:MAG TPA: phosphohistidine phosphatase SixA [Myxococcales bacterium]|jgi:phosphohistidine phosphatase